MNWILDASAVLCWLNGEPGWERMRDLVTGSGQDPMLLHAVNLVEIQYYFLRRSEQSLQVAAQRIEAAGIDVDRTMDDRLLTTATRIKAHHPPIALGDTFAVALAVQQGGTLLTTDRGEFEKVAAAGVCQVEFLR